MIVLHYVASLSQKYLRAWKLSTFCPIYVKNFPIGKSLSDPLWHFYRLIRTRQRRIAQKGFCRYGFKTRSERLHSISNTGEVLLRIQSNVTHTIQRCRQREAVRRGTTKEWYISVLLKFVILLIDIIFDDIIHLIYRSPLVRTFPPLYLNPLRDH